jgi:hypothetical protein
MAGRDRVMGAKHSRNAASRRRRGVIMGGAIGACLAAAAMATGSAITAAAAKADFDDLIDPIIQPILTHVADALAGVDPSGAADLTSWTDSTLGGLSSFDPAAAVSSTSDSLAATSSTPDAASGSYDIPITVQEDTEPSVQATVDGSNTTLLVDTGSSGLVVPWQDLGSSAHEVVRALHESGAQYEGKGESGYSGGVDYKYREYDDVNVSYGNGELTNTNSPIDVVMHSHGTGHDSPKNFEQFLKDNDVTGILGVGDNDAGPTESPFDAVGYTGVTVDIPQGELVVNANPGTAIATVDGAPITKLTEELTTNGSTVSKSVTDDVDSGGVYGTIPSSLESGDSVPSGSTISVYDGSTLLYSYTTGTDSLGDSTAPTVVSGTSIDSGVEPYLEEPIYIDYANDTLTFDQPVS